MLGENSDILKNFDEILYYKDELRRKDNSVTLTQ